MKKITLLFAFGALFLAGCPKHEIIPAPQPKVQLTSHFVGTINGSYVELTQNVEGYYLDATNVKTIFPSPNPSKAIYSATMKSSQQMVSIGIVFGAVQFDASSSGGEPSLAVFNSFFNSNLTPPYAAGGDGGFEVVYRDGSGAVWTSDPAGTGQDVEFTSIVQESDSKGDYTKFTCTFNCVVYRSYLDLNGDLVTLSLPIQNAVLKAWFKR